MAWFQFTVQAPPTPGTYRLAIRPLIEGTTWMEDYGVFWFVTVASAAALPTPAPSPAPTLTPVRTPAQIVPTAPPSATAPPTSLPVTAGYRGAGGWHWVSKNIQAAFVLGYYIVLEDQSLWEIDSLDRISSMLWLPADAITVVADSTCIRGYRLIDTTPGNSSSGCARYLGSAGAHWVSKNVDSGHYILLEDQSLWEIDLLDRIGALLWLTTESITVVEDRTCVWSYRLINTDDSSTACARFLSYSR